MEVLLDIQKESVYMHACACVLSVFYAQSCSIMRHSFLLFYVHIFTLQVIELENRCRRSAQAKI